MGSSSTISDKNLSEAFCTPVRIYRSPVKIVKTSIRKPLQLLWKVQKMQDSQKIKELQRKPETIGKLTKKLKLPWQNIGRKWSVVWGKIRLPSGKARRTCRIPVKSFRNFQETLKNWWQVKKYIWKSREFQKDDLRTVVDAQWISKGVFQNVKAKFKQCQEEVQEKFWEPKRF